MSEDKSITPLLPLHCLGRCVRTYTDERGIMWWVAQDVGDLLGITQVRKNLRTFPEDEKGVTTGNTSTGPQPMLTINEPGLYRLIFLSRKPEAEQFKRLVFHDILPAIRQTGRYLFPSTQERELRENTAVKLPPFLAPSQEAQTALPAPRPPVRERAEVSTHLIAVWRVLLHAEEPLTNRDIARLADIGSRTARAHTYYLSQLGLVDVYEAYPRHLYRLAAQAQKRNTGYYQRLEEFRAIYDAQAQRVLRGLD